MKRSPLPIRSRKTMAVAVLAILLVSLAVFGLSNVYGLALFQVDNPTLDESAQPQRAVQMDINRVLLKATILRATFQVVRFGAGVNEPTGTAFAQEFQENLAAIDTLRPTAEAYRIILIEKAVAPPDDLEQTLFAQAIQADHAMNPHYAEQTATSAAIVRPTATPVLIFPPTPTAR